MRGNELLSAAERELLGRGRFGRRMGFGARPAVLCIDCQVYMVGDRDEPQELSTQRFPSSCGHVGWQALQHTAQLLQAARAQGVPVFYTAFTLAPDGRDAGVYALKRDLLQSQGWALEGSPGAQISPLVAPAQGEIVLTKHKPSAFFGTPLLSHLVQRGVDTLLVTGGATSNCVRATVFDAASYNLRAMVIEECVFDRIELSHRVSLMDMDRQFADVIALAEALAYVRGLPAQEAAAPRALPGAART